MSFWFSYRLRSPYQSGSRSTLEDCPSIPGSRPPTPSYYGWALWFLRQDCWGLCTIRKILKFICQTPDLTKFYINLIRRPWNSHWRVWLYGNIFVNSHHLVRKNVKFHTKPHFLMLRYENRKRYHFQTWRWKRTYCFTSVFVSAMTHWPEDDRG